MNTTEYSLVSTESRTINESQYWSNRAVIVDFGICKLVQLIIYRKSNMNINNNWTEILGPSYLPSDLLPSDTVTSSEGRQKINFQLNNTNGIRAQAETSGSYSFLVTFNYIVTNNDL